MIFIRPEMKTSKSEATPQKLCEKIATMLKSYKDTRTMVDRTGWGVDATQHDETPDGQNTDGAKTIHQIILEKCPCYYVYEELMCDEPNVSPGFLRESGQLDRRHLKPVDVDGASTADASDDEEMNQTQLPDSQAENDDAVDTTEASDENALGEEGKKEKGTVDTAEKIMKTNNNVSISTTRNTRQLLSDFDKDFSDDDTSQNSTLVEDFRSPSPAPKSKKTAAAARITSRSKKRRGKTETEPYLIPTDSENKRGRKKAKGTPSARSLADALVEIEDKKITLAMEKDRLARLDRQQHLDREVKQRGQQHEEKGYQHQ